ncbi:MAG: hypothetical protein EAZ47_07940 [Bacteroidetes bacterium]|nr:MAG: hypothetical protein EAY72_08415 [Bacteroidota bacterium]TAF92936.1 MAG: hypothetical protein EAZ47_07940 [Bacteroidota bacterium]
MPSKHFCYQQITSSAADVNNDKYAIHNNLISFDKYLFEFNVGPRIIDSMNAGSTKIFRTIRYDTLSVFVLNSEDRNFYEFDTFAVTCNLLGHGPFSNKSAGMKLADTMQKPLQAFYEKKMQDTTLWNQRLFYFSDIQKNRNNEDSVRAYIFFLKQKNFTSLYDLMTAKYIDPNFNMVGFSYKFIEQNITAESVLKNLRPLTSKEEEICSSIVKKIPKK